jgi:hypothetical protein
VYVQENNGIGTLDLTDPLGEMSYYNLGRKNWAGLQFDGSYDDGGQFFLLNRVEGQFFIDLGRRLVFHSLAQTGLIEANYQPSTF